MSDKIPDEEIQAMLDRDDAIGALCALVKNAGLTMTLYGKPVDEDELRGHAAERVDQRLSSAIAGVAPGCQNFAPPDHAGHWRDWHRGHGCELDPSIVRPYEAHEEHRCSHPEGTHPRHRNYCESAAENDGPVCELGWPK